MCFNIFVLTLYVYRCEDINTDLLKTDFIFNHGKLHTGRPSEEKSTALIRVRDPSQGSESGVGVRGQSACACDSKAFRA